MISLNQKFKTIHKDRLFHNRFEYSIGFYLDEVNCLRELSHEEIDNTIARRKVWREISQHRLQNNSTIMRRSYKEITDSTVQSLHDLAEILLQSQSDYKLVVTVNQGWIYSNDLALLHDITQQDFLKHITYSKAKITRPQNTITLKNSQYQYRSYFKMVKLSNDQKHYLKQFFCNQKDHLRISPSFQKWLGQPFNRLQDYFFIDYDNKSWLTALSLIQPGLIRKTMQIISAK